MGCTCSTYGDKRGDYRVLVGKPEGKRHLGDPEMDGRIILRWICRKWDLGVCTGLIWSMIRRVVGHL
jgi:hypothetical protein